MSDQPTPKGRGRGTSKTTRAAAGVAGALAFLGIGWAMGARAATTQQPTASIANGPTGTVPVYPTVPLPGEWGDEDGGQWSTVPQPGSLVPAQPGTGGVVPPTTGSGGSSVGGTSVTTTNATTPQTPATTVGAP